MKLSEKKEWERAVNLFSTWASEEFWGGWNMALFTSFEHDSCNTSLCHIFIWSYPFHLYLVLLISSLFDHFIFIWSYSFLLYLILLISSLFDQTHFTTGHIPEVNFISKICLKHSLEIDTACRCIKGYCFFISWAVAIPADLGTVLSQCPLFPQHTQPYACAGRNLAKAVYLFRCREHLPLHSSVSPLCQIVVLLLFSPYSLVTCLGPLVLGTWTSCCFQSCSVAGWCHERSSESDSPETQIWPLPAQTQQMKVQITYMHVYILTYKNPENIYFYLTGLDATKSSICACLPQAVNDVSVIIDFW